MEIIFIRHGQTDANNEGVLQGQTDTELNGVGVLESERLKEKIGNMDYDIIYSSDLKRAYTTASIINSKHKRIVKDKRLRERHMGMLQGKKAYDKSLNIDYEKLTSDSNYLNYGIEPLDDVVKRVYELIEEIIKTGCERILVVSHGFISLVFRNYFYGGSHRWADNKIINCGMIRFHVEGVING